MSGSHRPRVLIVEDDYLVRQWIQQLLEQAGYSVAGVALDGPQAVAQTEALQPDVVLMDIGLPGDMDGLEAARRINLTCPTPVVVLTAYESPEMLERASAAGAGAYLTKPTDERALERAITIAPAQRRVAGRNRAPPPGRGSPHAAEPGVDDSVRDLAGGQ